MFICANDLYMLIYVEIEGMNIISNDGDDVTNSKAGMLLQEMNGNFNQVCCDAVK